MNLIICENIKKARKRAGISQAELSKTMKKCREQICDWERGRNIMTIENLIAFCKAVGSDPNEILGFDEMEAI